MNSYAKKNQEKSTKQKSGNETQFSFSKWVYHNATRVEIGWKKP